MQQLIPMINEIQDIMAQAKCPTLVDLPQIVVIGAQSTGKSSVLESIVGQDFLPRGEGIVTRRPLVLHLNNTKKGPDYGVFKHNSEKKFENYDEIRQEIEADTQKVAGKSKNISEEQIILDIYSPNVLNLTLVDLPGMTKVPIGDQPKDIELKTRDLVYSYAKNPNAVILAVSSANTDLANSDSLKLAREVDPDGLRTLGVLTKLDIMDKGTNAIEMLEGKVYGLALGYVGVVCRSQKDINEKKSIDAALKSEKEFFEKHPDYFKIKERLGIPYLAKTLSDLLKKHIQKSLPALKKKLADMIMERKRELEEYGEDHKEKYKENLDTLVLHVIQKYNEAFQQRLLGTAMKESEELIGGARILNICVHRYRKMLDNKDLFKNLSDKTILHSIMNARGLRPCLFIPDAAFEILIKKRIKEFIEPSLMCLTEVASELINISGDLLPEYRRYEPLYYAILSVVGKLIENQKKEAEKEVRSTIKIEKSFINMYHPDFKEAIDNYMREENDRLIAEALEKIHKLETPAPQPPEYQISAAQPQLSYGPAFGNIPGSSYAPQPPAKKKQPAPLNFGKGEILPKPLPVFRAPANKEEDKQENLFDTISPDTKMEATIKDLPRQEDDMRLIKKMLLCYYEIVKKTLKDKIPKIVMFFMIKKLNKKCEDELMKKIYREGNANELLEEQQELVLKRKSCVQKLEALNKSYEVICKYST